MLKNTAFLEIRNEAAVFYSHFSQKVELRQESLNPLSFGWILIFFYEKMLWLGNLCIVVYIQKVVIKVL